MKLQQNSFITNWQYRRSIFPETVPVKVLTKEDVQAEAYYDSLEYLAACVEAEAGNQGYTGKRLVACVILNRVEAEGFPDSIEAVINQKNQFDVVACGSIYTVDVTQETFEAVTDELEQRSNRDILYFREGCYHSFGTPILKHKDHYFSGR